MLKKASKNVCNRTQPNHSIYLNTIRRKKEISVNHLMYWSVFNYKNINNIAY